MGSSPAHLHYHTSDNSHNNCGHFCLLLVIHRPSEINDQYPGNMQPILFFLALACGVTMAAPTNETPSSALGKREDVITCGLECLKDSVQCQKVANKDDGKLLQCVKWAVACNTECACLDQVENHGGDIVSGGTRTERYWWPEQKLTRMEQTAKVYWTPSK